VKSGITPDKGSLNPKIPQGVKTMTKTIVTAIIGTLLLVIATIAWSADVDSTKNLEIRKAQIETSIAKQRAALDAKLQARLERETKRAEVRAAKIAAKAWKYDESVKPADSEDEKGPYTWRFQPAYTVKGHWRKSRNIKKADK
jgi:hypothetical protein